MASALYGFAYAPQALAYLKTIQPKLRSQIIKRIQGLSGEPFPHNSRTVQSKMDGERRVHRIRSGDYRVLYSVRENPDQIVILDIDHRKDVYR
jgi:mRNA interferase RelE/StbE